ncbi:hypothetical protein K501DRAFT_275096 [Backusella circina FSU 941]|nr:hypothetical protein K501DRAFT_275096 [Backusella circina FSU 941]
MHISLNPFFNKELYFFQCFIRKCNYESNVPISIDDICVGLPDETLQERVLALRRCQSEAGEYLGGGGIERRQVECCEFPFTETDDDEDYPPFPPLHIFGSPESSVQSMKGKNCSTRDYLNRVKLDDSTRNEADLSSHTSEVTPVGTSGTPLLRQEDVRLCATCVAVVRDLDEVYDVFNSFEGKGEQEEAQEEAQVPMNRTKQGIKKKKDTLVAEKKKKRRLNSSTCYQRRQYENLALICVLHSDIKQVTTNDLVFLPISGINILLLRVVYYYFAIRLAMHAIEFVFKLIHITVEG